MVWLCPECSLTMPEQYNECNECNEGTHPDVDEDDSERDYLDAWHQAHSPSKQWMWKHDMD